MKSFEELGREIGQIVAQKNKAYGNSFAISDEFLKLLFPNGIHPKQYGDVLCLVRIFDKMKRIASQKEAFGENPYLDIAGYGLLGSTFFDEVLKMDIIIGKKAE